MPRTGERVRNSTTPVKGSSRGRFRANHRRGTSERGSECSRCQRRPCGRGYPCPTSNQTGSTGKRGSHMAAPQAPRAPLASSCVAGLSWRCSPPCPSKPCKQASKQACMLLLCCSAWLLLPLLPRFPRAVRCCTRRPHDHPSACSSVTMFDWEEAKGRRGTTTRVDESCGASVVVAPSQALEGVAAAGGPWGRPWGAQGGRATDGAQLGPIGPN